MNRGNLYIKKTAGRSQNVQTPVVTKRGAFTLIELLVVIAIIAILAAILMPVLNAAKLKAQGVECMNNLHQVVLAVNMYVNENQNYFPLNCGTKDTAYSSPGSAGNGLNWVSGIMSYTGNTDSTNYMVLVDSQHSQLAPYLANPKSYRCPGDQSTQLPQLQGVARVRSYAMSAAIGLSNIVSDTPRPQRWLNTLSGSKLWQIYARQNQMIGLGPADILMLYDEDPDFVDDGLWTFHMPEAPNEATWSAAGSSGGDNEMATKYHGNGCPFGFADGHSEIHGWQNPGAIATTVYQTSPPIPNQTPNNQDIWWIANHYTQPQP